MSVIPSRWVWEHSPSSGNDLIVELKIADNANDDGGGAYPGVPYLARAARVSVRTAYDCLKRLKRAGRIVEEQHGGGKGRKTIYRVIMDLDESARIARALAGQAEDDSAEPAGDGPPNGAGSAPYPAAKGAGSAPYPAGETVQPDVQTVQPAALNGAVGRVTSMEEPSLNRPKNRPSPRRRSSPRQQPAVSEEVVTLCQHLADRILANGASPKRFQNPTKASWTRAMAGLLDDLELDPGGRTVPYAERVARVRRAIDWAQGDRFWRKNILSPASLRDQYDRLRLAATEGRQGGNGYRPVVDVDAQAAALKSTDPQRRPGQDYTDEQIAELTRLTEAEWAGRDYTGRVRTLPTGQKRASP